MDTQKSTTSTNRTRGLHRGTGSHKPNCPCLVCKGQRYNTLEARITELQISNNHNAAEVTRLAEALRLAEQGRDKALAENKTLTGEKNTLVDKLLGMEAQDGAMREELYALKMRLENVAEDRDAAKTAEIRTAELLRLLSIEHDALKQQKRTAEGRYVAISRRRTTEWAVLAFALLGSVVLTALATLVGRWAR